VRRALLQAAEKSPARCARLPTALHAGYPYRITRIRDYGRKLLGDLHPSRRLCQQHHATVRRQPPATSQR
jgi:hypothetical protein